MFLLRQILCYVSFCGGRGLAGGMSRGLALESFCLKVPAMDAVVERLSSKDIGFFETPKPNGVKYSICTVHT